MIDMTYRAPCGHRFDCGCGAPMDPPPHCDDCTDPPRRYFYVSVIHGRRKGLLAGPYDSHADALDKVDVVRARAKDADPFSDFYAFGTAGSDDLLPTVFGRV